MATTETKKNIRAIMTFVAMLCALALGVTLSASHNFMGAGGWFVAGLLFFTRI